MEYLFCKCVCDIVVDADGFQLSMNITFFLTGFDVSVAERRKNMKR